MIIQAFCDANWAATSGGTIFLGTTLISRGLVNKQLLLDPLQKQILEELPQPPPNFFGFNTSLCSCYLL